MKSSPIFFFIFQQLFLTVEFESKLHHRQRFSEPQAWGVWKVRGHAHPQKFADIQLTLGEPAPSSDEFDVEAVLAGATRQAAASTRSRYKPTKHVSPTGNMCESLFSVCKHTMTDYRRHMGPEKLEATLILRCNYDLWQGQIGQKLIQEIMNDEKAARKAAAVAAVAAVTADDELDGFSGITDDTGY